MKWKEYFNRRRLYKKAWNDMKGEFDGEARRFLDKSRLVITYGPRLIRQMDFERESAYSVATTNPGFFIKDGYSDKFFSLIRRQDETVALAVKYNSIEALRDYYCELRYKFRKHLEEFGVDFLNVEDNQTEIRFPTLNMELIQKIKKSKYCDTKRTDMGICSIRVVLNAV